MTEQEAQALIAEGAGIDAGQAAHDEAAATGMLDDKGQIIVPPDDTQARAAEWFIIPKTLAWAITAVFPETAPHYTDEKCMELAHAILPVAEKYGLNGIGESPELMLLLGTGMFCAPGYLAYKARKAAQLEQAAKAKRDGNAPPAPGETFIAPINGTAAGNGG
jgi:hypothetical protein